MYPELFRIPFIDYTISTFGVMMAVAFLTGFWITSKRMPEEGIDPKQHDRIFEIFQSLGPCSDGRRGTGIGLAIVKKIAETQGGRVRVESTPGEGSVFQVQLPRCSD